jgi:hypothetical protein
MYRIVAIFGIFLMLFVSCDGKGRSKYGYVRIVFEHHWENKVGNTSAPMLIDERTPYENAAGNILTFKNLEYFISNLKISGASNVSFNTPNIHYIRYDSAYSTLFLTQQISAGQYETISFMFGIDSSKNKSNIFPNAPQKDMFWPPMMGGGYHHMKIDGKWKNQGEPEDQPFNLHLGDLKETTLNPIFGQSVITQQWDSITGYDTVVQIFRNSFPVSIPKFFEIKSNEITTVYVTMYVNRWMEGEHTWNFNIVTPIEVMHRQPAMDSLVKNGGFNHGQSLFR